MAVARKSRGTRVRHLGLAGRAGTVLLAASIGVLSPAAAALPAWAQESNVPPEAGGYYATPPPVDESKLPGDNGGKPDQKYKKTKECVTRSLGETVDIKNRPWGQEYLQVEALHRIMRGATGSIGGGIKVAVIDTGVTPHPYFQNRLSGIGDYVLETAPAPGLEDCDGHGTEVAGIIGGNPPDPTIGFRGVAPDSSILSIRQSSQNYAKDDQPAVPPPSSQPAAPPGSDTAPPPSSEIPPTQSNGASGGRPDNTTPGQNGRQQEQQGSAGSLTTLAQAVVRAVNAGAQVINMSVDNCRRADGRITPGEQALQAAVHNAVERNVVVVAAAGNTDEKSCPQNDQADPKTPKMIVTPPWFADDVLSVAAIEPKGGVASFSVHGPWISVAAPGTEIISLDPAAGSDKLANLTIEGNGEPGPIQGTSFAAPYVAGVAALVRAKFPHLSARAVMNRIMTTAQHPAAPGGRDNFVGFGVINAMAALTASVPSEEGLENAQPVQLPSDLPPADNQDKAPMIVALAGTGGGLVALLITLFVVHTIRRNRPATNPTRGNT